MRTLGYTTARAALLAVASAVSAAMKSTFVGCFDNRYRWAFSASQALSSQWAEWDHGLLRAASPWRTANATNVASAPVAVDAHDHSRFVDFTLYRENRAVSPSRWNCIRGRRS